jgi:hypothetical protein
MTRLIITNHSPIPSHAISRISPAPKTPGAFETNSHHIAATTSITPIHSLCRASILTSVCDDIGRERERDPFYCICLLYCTPLYCLLPRNKVYVRIHNGDGREVKDANGKTDALRCIFISRKLILTV